jgi:multiple sugar transport system permease protein/fructooligosaccharide transport system permease protein
MMRRGFFWMLSAVVAFLFLAPLLWMLGGSFAPEASIFTAPFGLSSLGDAQLEHYLDAWRRADMGRALFNSLLQVAGILGLGLIVNSMAAFAFARLHFRGRNLLFLLVVALMILPMEVIVIPLFLTARDLSLTGPYPNVMAGLILPFTAKAVNIFFLRQHFLSLPVETEEAALIDGAGWFRMYLSVALPSIRPALSTVITLDLITHWSDFLWPLVMCTREETRTVQIAMANLFTQPPVQWGDILACAVLLTLPVMLFFRFAQRHLVSSELATGNK